MKLIEILKYSEEYLEKNSFKKSRLEAEKIISHILKMDRLGLYANFEKELNSIEKDEIKKYLKEMVKNRQSFSELKKEPMENFELKNKELLEKTREYLKNQGIKEYKIDAKYIFAHVLKVEPSFLELYLKKEISLVELEEIKKITILRGKYRKPLQQILGEWEFYGYPFYITEDVLIPRSDTENLVENCKGILQEKLQSKDLVNVLDIGTGSGAIAISLGKEVTNSKIVGLDISLNALEVAKKNKELNKVDNVEFYYSDLFEIFKNIKEEKALLEGITIRKFDLIVSNPPYIPLNEYEELMPEVKNHEPKGALTDGGDGYFFYDKISREAKEYLEDGGVIAFEVGYNQSHTVAEFLQRDGYKGIRIIKDYSQIERIVIGVKTRENII